MRHSKIQKMLSLYVDGRVSSTEKNYIQDHINSCKECADMLASFKQLKGSAHKPDVKVNPFFASRVLADLHSRQREAFWTVFDILPRPLVVAGLTLAIITLAVFATPYSPLRDTSTSEFSLLYADQTERAVSDDEALAIAINADIVSTGE